MTKKVDNSSTSDTHGNSTGSLAKIEVLKDLVGQPRAVAIVENVLEIMEVGEKTEKKPKANEIWKFLFENKDDALGHYNLSDEQKSDLISLRGICEGQQKFEQRTFVQYVSNGASAVENRIRSAGRRAGYYLAEVEASSEDAEGAPDDAEQKLEESGRDARQQREKQLYSFFADWLSGNDDTEAVDISGKRGNPKWQNPDVIGLRIWDFYENHQFELISIEVKNSKKNWEQRWSRKSGPVVKMNRPIERTI